MSGTGAVGETDEKKLSPDNMEEEIIKKTSTGLKDKHHKRTSSKAPPPAPPSIERYRHKVVKGNAIKLKDFENEETEAEYEADKESRDERYFQHPKGKRILLVDGMHACMCMCFCVRALCIYRASE